ncbi:hypothetical protein Bca101_049008 [Brassica carinata]
MIVGVLIQDVRTENRTMRSRFLFQLGSIAVSFDMEQKGIEVLGTDSEGSNSSVSWRNIGDCNNSPSSTQSVSYPIKTQNGRGKIKVRKDYAAAEV